MPPSPTKLARLGIGTADPVTIAMNFSSFDPGVTRELLDNNGTRGTFFKDGNRMSHNRTVVTPSFSSEPTSTELTHLLHWIFSGTPTGGGTKTYPFANDAAQRFVHFKPVAGEEFFLSGVAVDTATLRAVSNGALTVEMGLCGMTENDAHATLPALTYDLALKPFLLTHLVLTVGGTPRPCRSFSLNLNFAIDKSRFLNSLTLTATQKLDTIVGVSFEVPSGDNAAGFWSSGIAGAAATAIFTNPTTSKVLSFTFPDLRFPAQAPNHPTGGEGFLTVNAEAMRVGQAATDYPVQVTLTD